MIKIIISILWIFLCIYLYIDERPKESNPTYKLYDEAFGKGMFSGVSFLLVGSILISGIADLSGIKSSPDAIDVYNHKTELRITSVNGVPTDTMVVWKKEYK